MCNIQLSKYDSSGVSENWQVPTSVMATIIPIKKWRPWRKITQWRIAFYGGELLVVGLLELGLDPCAELWGKIQHWIQDGAPKITRLPYKSCKCLKHGIW
jgi:hypothetical protein